LKHFIDQKTKTDMDLIDHFAGLAMQSYVAKEPHTTDPDDVAEWSYNVALAMMAHRDEMFDGLPD
jgi:hypothetical protein